MVKESIKQNLHNTELSFFDNIEVAANNESLDLIYASGSVHYTPKPYKTLEKLVNIDGKVFIITRTPICDKEAILLLKSTFKDNGIGEIPKNYNFKNQRITYPVTILEKNILRK